MNVLHDVHVYKCIKGKPELPVGSDWIMYWRPVFHLPYLMRIDGFVYIRVCMLVYVQHRLDLKVGVGGRPRNDSSNDASDWHSVMKTPRPH